MTEQPEARFITFEGGDGSGKSTQLRLLAEQLRLKGLPVAETAEPGGTQAGLLMRQILLQPASPRLSSRAELLLYFAARAQNVDELILPALQRGKVVLCDRFTDSTLAYQGAARHLGQELVLALHRIACHDLWPDLTLWIDVAPQVALRRLAKRGGASSARDRLETEDLAFHLAVWEAYRELARTEPKRIHRIDGLATIADVAVAVWRVVAPHLRLSNGS